jgi:predicted AAA+ superfamily ATPase
LLNLTQGTLTTLQYWREGQHEVDFVLSNPQQKVLIEVKSGTTRNAYSGAEALRKQHGNVKLIVVGGHDNMSIKEFMSASQADIMT